MSKDQAKTQMMSLYVVAVISSFFSFLFVAILILVYDFIDHSYIAECRSFSSELETNALKAVSKIPLKKCTVTVIAKGYG